MHDINNIEANNILVIGDVMLDTYYVGEVKRISPEAPVPVFHKKSERSVLGGAANVASNLVAAGQNVFVMSIVGNDDKSDKLRAIFEQEGINIDNIISLDRSTTEKTRFLAMNNQQVLRLDVEDTEPLTHDECQQLLVSLQNSINKYDLILISDYLKGLLTYEFTQGVIDIAKKYEVPVIIDVKDPKFDKYKNATLLKPNLKEIADLTGMKVDTDEQIIEASQFLRDKCQCKYILTTCGARGMVLVGDAEPYFVDAVGQEVFDVTGAGDTTIAYLAACITSGMSMREAVNISNTAASIQVSKVGTSSVYWSEIREKLIGQLGCCEHKVISWDKAGTLRKENRDKKIVFTNGCFDILHVGHIRYLQEAAKLGDLLIVGLNSDDSVKRLKGTERPINAELERAEILATFAFIDYVVIFDEDTPYGLIKKIQPDVLVKGGDYKPEDVVGCDIVESRGGRLVLIPFVEGKSTTRIIEKIKN